MDRLEYWQIFLVVALVWGAWAFGRRVAAGLGRAAAVMAAIILGVPVALGVAVMLSGWGVFDERLCIAPAEKAPKSRRVSVPGETDTFADRYYIPEVPCDDPRSTGVGTEGTFAASARATVEAVNEQLAEQARARALSRP